MSAINVNSITGRTGGHGPVLTGVTTVSDGNLVVIGTGASIGIGTSAPDAPLHVATAPDKATIAIFGSTDETSSATYQALSIRNDVSSYPALSNASSTDTLDLRSAGSVQVTIDSNNNDTTKHFRVTTNGSGDSGTELFRVDEDGNVGIGTDNPSRILHVSSSNDQYIRVTSTNSANAGIEFGDSADKGRANIVYANSDDSMFFTVNGSEKVRIESGGNVGIGTDNPSETLTLNHDSGASIGLEYSGIENGTINVNSAAMYVRAGSNRQLIIGADGTEGARFNTSNGFGINATTIPDGVNVAVGGTIRVQDSTDATQYLTINHLGIDFQNTGAGSSTSSTSHLLDDYEEGSFTPGLRGSSTAGSPTFTRNQGAYVKVGRLVTCFIYIALSNKGGMVGDLDIINLPFTVADILPNTGVDGGGLLHYYASPADSDITRITVLPDDGTATADLFFGKTGVSMGALQDDDINDNFNFRAVVSYHA